MKGLLLRFFKCAYQAKVMNTFDKVSSRTVCNSMGIPNFSAMYQSSWHLFSAYAERVPATRSPVAVLPEEF